METMVLKVISDALMVADRENDFTVLANMSAASHTVNDNILIDRLQTAFAICGTVL